MALNAGQNLPLTHASQVYGDQNQVITATVVSGKTGLDVNVITPGGGGSAVTITGPLGSQTIAASVAVTEADGNNVTIGATTDAAVVGDVSGTVSAKLRGISKILNSVWSSPNNWLAVSIQNTVLAVTQSGVWTVALSAGAALIGKVGIDQTTPGTTNGVQTLSGSTTAVTGSVTVAQATAANLQAQVGGPGAAGAAVSGNPLRVGALARTTLPTSVSSAQLADVLVDRYGRQYVLSPVVSTIGSGSSHITTATNTQIVAAPSAGNHLRIHRLWAQNGATGTATWCYWGNGSGNLTGGPSFSLAANQPFGMDIKGGWELSTATGLFINTATSGADIGWYVEYETLAD